MESPRGVQLIAGIGRYTLEAIHKSNLKKRETLMTDHDHSKAITALNTLTATTIDSVNGYEESAKNIENTKLAELFRKRATERQQVVQDLRAEVRKLGGDVEDDGSFLGKTHQLFEDLKAAVTGRDEKAIINEVERGEDYIKGKYETVLESDVLTGECRSVVERAFQSVRSGHDEISQMKHSMEAAS